MTREYPDRPFVGIGVIVWCGGRVLLVRRARPPRQGQWSLPGGLQELGEGVLEAARREVREETGLDIDILGIADVVDLIERNDAGRVRYHSYDDCPAGFCCPVILKAGKSSKTQPFFNVS